MLKSALELGLHCYCSGLLAAELRWRGLMTSSSDSPGCPSRGRGPVGPLLQRQQSFPMLKLPPVCTFYGALNCHWVAPGTTINAFSDAEYLVGRPRLCQMDWVSSHPFPSTPPSPSLPPPTCFFFLLWLLPGSSPSWCIFLERTTCRNQRSLLTPSSSTR